MFALILKHGLASRGIRPVENGDRLFSGKPGRLHAMAGIPSRIGLQPGCVPKIGFRSRAAAQKFPSAGGGAASSHSARERVGAIGRLHPGHCPLVMLLGAESGQRIEHSHRAFWMDMPLAVAHLLIVSMLNLHLGRQARAFRQGRQGPAVTACPRLAGFHALARPAGPRRRS